jgi:hypothetical protein
MQMKPRFYHPPKKRGPWTTEKYMIVGLFINSIEHTQRVNL